MADRPGPSQRHRGAPMVPEEVLRAQKSRRELVRLGMRAS